jgi:hypothetical protein
MTTIDWQIEQMSCYPEVEGQTDVVFSVAWRVNGTDGTYFASAYGSESISPYNGKSPFTPYSELTKEQVIGWVQDAMGESHVAAINASIKHQIANQINPPIITPALPWITNSKGLS